MSEAQKKRLSVWAGVIRSFLMVHPYQAPAEEGVVELLIKKSRFIGYCYQVENREQAEKKIIELRKLHPKANHHCYAYIASNPDDTNGFAFSDDGEPSGTAGKPMLNILQHSGIGNILVVAVRYFGGVKLGTGGLVSAYSETTKAVLEDLKTVLIEEKAAFGTHFPYALEPIVRNILDKFNLEGEATYSESVEFVLRLSENEVLLLKKELEPLNIELNAIE